MPLVMLKHVCIGNEARYACWIEVGIAVQQMERSRATDFAGGPFGTALVK